MVVVPDTKNAPKWAHFLCVLCCGRGGRWWWSQTRKTRPNRRVFHVFCVVGGGGNPRRKKHAQMGAFFVCDGGGGAGTGTTMYCSQHSTERLHCICNNVATERARSSTVRIYYICIIGNGYTAFATSAIHTVSSALSHWPSYRHLLLAIGKH